MAKILFENKTSGCSQWTGVELLFCTKVELARIWLHEMASSGQLFKLISEEHRMWHSWMEDGKCSANVKERNITNNIYIFICWWIWSFVDLHAIWILLSNFSVFKKESAPISQTVDSIQYNVNDAVWSNLRWGARNEGKEEPVIFRPHFVVFFVPED